MKRMIKDSVLTGIADAIREKNGTDNKYEDVEMAQAILDIKGGDEFIGIKYSDFEVVNTSNHCLPTVGDARSLEGYLGAQGNKYGWLGSDYLFASYAATTNGGYTAALKTVYVPNGLLTLYCTFLNCVSLETIYGDLSLVESTDSSFRNCKNLKEIPYMPNLNSIGASTFASCNSLTSVKLYKTPTLFQTNALSGCTNLLDIYVPWAEGEVANAPWGATNATIHYNTQFDENHNPII